MSTPVEPIAPVEAPAAAKKGLGRGPLIAIIAGATVLVLVIAAVVVSLVFSRPSPSASAVAFPKNTLYWAEFAIDPSMPQKVEAFRFVNEIDALRDAIEDSDLDVDLDDPESYSDVKESVWKLLVNDDSSGIDTDLDYDDDIAPWLGSRISVGMLPGGDLEEPPLIVAIEARDTNAGIDAIEQLLDDADIDADVDARNGYVIVATGDVDLDDVYDDGTLNTASSFSTASASAGDWGWASVYVDLGAMYSSVYETATQNYDDVEYWRSEIENNYYAYVDDSAYEYVEECPESTAEQTDDEYDANYYDCTYAYLYNGETYEYYDDFASAWVDDNVDELAQQKVEDFADAADQQEAVIEKLDGTTAFVVSRFVNGSFEVSGVVNGVKDLEMDAAPSEGEGQLPASTVALISLTGLAHTLDTALSDDNLAASAGGLGALSYGGGAPEVTRDDVEEWFDETLGVDFPDDLTELFGSKLLLVVDSDLDFSELEQSDSPSSLGDVAGGGMALIVTSDDVKATASAWEDLLDNAEDQIGGDLGIDVETEGNRVILTGGDYLDALLAPEERLGDLDAFRRAVPNVSGASAVIYLNVDELADLVDDLGGNGALDFVDGIQALGVTSTRLTESSYSFVLRVTTEAD